jgi:outer membrane receptor for ferrienterochelin and colicins
MIALSALGALNVASGDDGQDDDRNYEHGHEHSSEEPQGHRDHGEDEHGHGHSLDAVEVVATRVGRSASDEPVRVEIIVREEIEEKAIMRPGNISMLVAETGGVRVQTTSPALGSANIRLQGLYGRYTQLLADGLPLYGGQAASIGLLQIPPTDLGHVEVIKGSASSLYGGSALGGVINLVSRRPGDALEGEALVNLTSRSGQDLTTYVAGPLDDSFRASLTAGAHRQSAQDLDDDGWIDMAEYERVTARPRLFWTGAGGARVYATAGFMAEERVGGTLPGRTVPDGSEFPQTQDTQRFDRCAGRPASARSIFESLQDIDGIETDIRDGIAAFHDEQRRFVQGGNGLAASQKIVALEREEGNRIVFESIDAQRDHQRIGGVVA